jgi:septal ring factor EnvC (AmiA/AmiB activator)
MAVMRQVLLVFATAWVIVMSSLVDGAPTETAQLERVRSRIGALERRLAELADQARGRQDERERLDAELELAQAKVREIELVLEQSQTEAVQAAEAAAAVGDELEDQRALLESHVEIMALLGRPGTMQLLFDGARGGDLEGAVSTVAVLTSGQVRLVEEYSELYRQRSERLAELSVILARARDEAESLERREAELEAVRASVERQIAQLERSQRNTRSELDELRQREQALERLLTTLSDRSRFTGGDDIREFRGALPWPATGRVVQEFGRRYLPKYSTYTVCNGLRFDAPSGSPVTAVFPGEVAYARFFKGYGNMVVVDHGHDVYSLAAGLATIHVRVNQPVSMGLRLGLASPPSDEGNTYFEIRVGKKPENPRRWLQLKDTGR